MLVEWLTVMIFSFAIHIGGKKTLNLAYKYALISVRLLSSVNLCVYVADASADLVFTWRSH